MWPAVSAASPSTGKRTRGDVSGKQAIPVLACLRGSGFNWQHITLSRANLKTGQCKMRDLLFFSPAIPASPHSPGPPWGLHSKHFALLVTFHIILQILRALCKVAPCHSCPWALHQACHCLPSPPCHRPCPVPPAALESSPQHRSCPGGGRTLSLQVQKNITTNKNDMHKSLIVQIQGPSIFPNPTLGT